MRKNRAVSLVLTGVFLWTQLAVAAEATPPTSELITLDADGIFLKDVLRTFSEQSRMSFVASEEVESKKINLSFNKVPLEEALQSIATANNLEYQKGKNNIILFYSRKTEGSGETTTESVRTETRIYRLKYSRLSNSPIDVGGKSTIDDLTSLQRASFDSSSSSSSSSSSTSTEASQASVTNVVAARGIDKVIASLLTSAGKVTADIQTNSIIVTDIPSKLDEIEKILDQIDQPVPQVLIEVYLMEIKKDLLSNQGIEWGGEDGAFATLTGGSRTTGFPFTENIFNKSQGVKATTQGTSTLTLGTLSASDFRATLHFLNQDINTKILARPRVLTMSNEAANIKLVTNAAIANQTTLTTSEGQATSTSNTAERSQVGITLKMTPQVNDDETVGLFLEPSITTVAASSFFPTTFLDPTTRVVRTVARVKNHQTFVIGGLMDKSVADVARKIPFLGDVPIAGKAFRYDDKSDTDRELVIFITPHIIDNYDSVSREDNQPMRQRDTAMNKILNEFEDGEMASRLDIVEAQEQKKSYYYRQEKKILQKTAKKPDDLQVVEAMTRSLDKLPPRQGSAKQ